MTAYGRIIIARLTLVVVLAMGSPVTSLAQTPAARVDSIFAFATATTPGCAVAAIRNGAVEYAKGYGMADLEHDVAITTQTPFYMASVSKQFAAAAVNLLALDGKLSLDDDVRKTIPELPEYGATITLRHLMHHTSGLRDYLTLFSLAGLTDYTITNADFLEMVGRQRSLSFRPGEQYSYSNTGYVLLSLVVERVSGKSLRTFAQERIFAPLGMTSTQFRDHHNMLIKGRALAYAPSRTAGYTLSVPHFDVVGDGGLYSTVEDLARWEANFLDPRVGGAEWLALEGQRGRLNGGAPIPYGAGLFHGTYRGETTVDHGGALGGYNIGLLRFPARRFSVAVLCNGNAVPSGLLARRVADVFLRDVLAPVTPAVTAPATPAVSVDLAPYKGSFFDDRAMAMRELVVEDGRLYFSRGPNNRSELVPLGGARFQMAGAPTVAVFSPRGDSLRLETSGIAVVLPRVRDAGRRDLRSYAGSYESSELKVAWLVTAGDSTLTVRPARGSSIRLDPAFEDAFRSPSILARFIRDDRGEIVAMDVSSGERARNVRFERRRGLRP